jgi:TRAP-type C4-dicarboxylate transport system permease small subunit
MRQLNHYFGLALQAVALIGCFLLFAMMLMICADVVLRLTSWGSLPWANEISEYSLYVATFLAAPQLLRMGKHVRLDLVLRALPPRLGWMMEWLVDLVGLGVCATLTLASLRILLASHASGSIVLKTLSFPEWWLLAPIPITFFLLAVEFVFRMYRLAIGPIELRDEAVSTA